MRMEAGQRRSPTPGFAALPRRSFACDSPCRIQAYRARNRLNGPEIALLNGRVRRLAFRLDLAPEQFPEREEAAGTGAVGATLSGSKRELLLTASHVFK